MNLQLTVAAIVAQIGHEHVVLQKIGNGSQTAVEHHTAVHIFVDHILANVADTNLAHRNKGIQTVVPHHGQRRDDQSPIVQIARLDAGVAFQFNIPAQGFGFLIGTLRPQIRHEIRCCQIDGFTFGIGINLRHIRHDLVVENRRIEDIQHVEHEGVSRVVGIAAVTHEIGQPGVEAEVERAMSLHRTTVGKLDIGIGLAFIDHQETRRDGIEG